MKITRKETIEREFIEKIQCDVCKKYFDDELDLQEFICLNMIGGYNSVIGDDVRWTIDICEKCFYEQYKDNIRIYNYEKDCFE